MLRPLSTTDGGLDSRQDLSRNRPRSPSFLAVLGFAEAREGSDSRFEALWPTREPMRRSADPEEAGSTRGAAGGSPPRKLARPTAACGRRAALRCPAGGA